MPYVVMTITKTAAVIIMGVEVELAISYADGMIGCVTVFETREQAEEFSDGVYEVTEVRTSPPNT